VRGVAALAIPGEIEWTEQGQLLTPCRRIRKSGENGTKHA
jgi:hypothetical protein